MNAHYDWIRYCYPKNQSPSFATAGFAPDPSDPSFKYVKDTLVSTQELSDLRCYVLLGEPGMGKSETFKSDYAAERKRLEPTKTKTELKNCTDLGGEASIIEFFNSGLISEWEASDQELILFLDSFDEGMLFTETWPSLLIRKLQELPIKRLKLRISCRPAVWPDSLEARLGELFNLGQLPIFSLAPLSEEHVKIAATAEGVNGTAFLTEVIRKAGIPFANKPLTLVFLLQTYKQTGSLPDSHVKLFSENCLRLCEELNPARRELSQVGELSASERLEIAKALAGISIFCNRPFFAKTSLELLNSNEKEAVDFNTAAPALAVGTTFGEFKETLNTGLFSARGEQMMGWAQQSFAEFLASDWVANHRLTNEDLWQLTTIDDGEARRIIPQLTTCAAWLTEIRRGYRTRVLKYDPAVLLNADETALDFTIRRKLVKRILELIEAGATAHSFRSQFYKLCHKHLARQLRPLFRKRKKSRQVRYAAIMIAESCKIKELESDILRLTLDQHEELFLRSAGAFSIGQFGSNDTRLALKEMALLPNDLDVDDDLKGWSLYALWPNNINALEVLACLTAPKRENYLGGYGSFIYRFADTLDDNFPLTLLPEAIKWATISGTDQRKLSYVSDAIVLLAFQNIENVGVADALAELVISRIMKHQEVVANFGALTKRTRFREVLHESSVKRRTLAQAIIPPAAKRGIPVYRFWSTGLFTSDDAEVYVAAWDKATVEQKQFISELIRSLPLTPILASVIRPAIENELMPKSMMDLFFVEFGSSTELAQKAAYKQELEYAPESRKPLVPTAKERIETRLHEIESGKPESWIWLACQDMLLGEYENDRSDDNADVMQLPGWEHADPSTKSRIVSAAETYVVSPRSYPLDFVPTNTIPWWAGAEYQGLLLILRSGGWSRLKNTDSKTWERWSTIALWYPFDRNNESQYELIYKLSERAEFVSGLQTLLLLMRGADNCYGIPQRIVAGWNKDVSALLVNLVQGDTLPKSCARELLTQACERDQDSFVPLVSARLRSAIAAHAPKPEISYWAGILLGGQPTQFWTEIWPLLTEAARLELITSIASTGNSTVFKDITDEAVIQIYLLLEREYPYDTDPKHGGGAYAVGARDQIADFRNTAFNIMKSRGLVRGIEKAMEEFGYPWLRAHRIEALKVRRQLKWSPWLPSKLFALISERKRNLLENPYVQFTGGVLVSLLAGLLLPELLSRTERAFYVAFVTIAILFVLNSQKLRQKNRLSFWLLFGVVLIYLILELAYFGYFRHP